MTEHGPFTGTNGLLKSDQHDYYASLSGQQLYAQVSTGQQFNAAQINTITEHVPRPPLTCTACRSYGLQSLALIAGSPLALALMSNRLVMNTSRSLLRGEAVAFDARVRDWCAEHAGPYLFHRDEDGNLVLGFETPQIAVHFALAFSGSAS